MSRCRPTYEVHFVSLCGFRWPSPHTSPNIPTRKQIEHLLRMVAHAHTCHTLQHTATHCNTQQHTATHYNALNTYSSWSQMEHTLKPTLKPLSTSLPFQLFTHVHTHAHKHKHLLGMIADRACVVHHISPSQHTHAHEHHTPTFPPHPPSPSLPPTHTHINAPARHGRG